MIYPLCVFTVIGNPPFQSIAVQDSVHESCDTEDDVLGPMLSVLMRWVSVNNYKVSKHYSFYLFPPSTTSPRPTQSVLS